MVKTKDIKKVPELRFTEFEGEWESKKLPAHKLNVIDGDRGGNYPNGDDFSSDGYCLFLNAKNVTKQGFSFEQKSFISKEKDQVLRKGKLKRNDLVLTTRGTVGNIAYYDESVTYPHIRINSGMVIIRNENTKLCPEFVYVSFFASSLDKQILKTTFGSAQPQLTVKGICQFKLAIPTLPEQEKIASFLSAVDKKIQQLTRKIELLERYKKGVMQKIFSQEIRFTDDNGKDYPDWQEKELGEVVFFIRNGISIDQNTDKLGIKVTRIETISDKRIDVNRVGYVNSFADLSEYKLQVGDLLFSNINSVAHIGKVVRVDFDYDLYHGMNLLNIRIDENANSSQFIYYVLTSRKYKCYFEKICNRAVNQASINQNDLKKTLLNLPTFHEQKKIAAYLSNIDKKIASVQSQLTQTETFKKGLLQQMFV